jgi:hypothetical protein
LFSAADIASPGVSDAVTASMEFKKLRRVVTWYMIKIPSPQFGLL